MRNNAGTFDRINTALTSQMLRMDEAGNFIFTIESTAGARSNPFVIGHGLAYANVELRALGGLVVQEGQDGGTGRGIYMYQKANTGWGIYMGQSGASKSLAGGTAVAGYDFSGFAIRSRVNTPSSGGVIWENAGEVLLMSLNASTGNLWMKRATLGGQLDVLGTNKIEFAGGGAGIAYLQEGWGLNLFGDATHPVHIRNAALLLGSSSGASFTAGRIYDANGRQIVRDRQADITNALTSHSLSYDTDVTLASGTQDALDVLGAKFNALLAALRTHGLIGSLS
jgi:hypothetical protein